MKKLLFTLIAILEFTSINAQNFDINKGLIAYYPFNSNTYDSINSNHGILHGAISTTDRFGNENSAYQFDGWDDYISISNSSELENIERELTLSVWFNTFSYYNGWAVIMGKSNIKKPSSEQYSFYYNSNGDIYFNNEIIAKRRIDSNKWYHFTLSYKDKQVNCYLNGKKIGSKEVKLGVVKNSLAIDIGRHIPGATEFYNGIIDDIRIYNRKMSENEIAMLFDFEAGTKQFIEKHTNEKYQMEALDPEKSSNVDFFTDLYNAKIISFKNVDSLRVVLPQPSELAYLTAIEVRLKDNDDLRLFVEQHHFPKERQAFLKELKNFEIAKLKMKQEKKLSERRHKLTNKYGKEVADKIINGKVWVGMTEEMLMDVKGRPDEIKETNTDKGVSKVYIYGYFIGCGEMYYNFYHFENGKFVKIEQQ